MSLSHVYADSMGPVPPPLDPAEKSRLTRLERTVERAVDAAGKIAGEALATIRDERLYRATHRSFEAYVLERFGFSRATAYRMIDAASRHELDAPDEGETAGGLVSRRDTPPAEASTPGDSCRAWATVTRSGPAGLRVAVDVGQPMPPRGARVEVVWG